MASEGYSAPADALPTTRIGLSPVRSDFVIGAYRTLLYNYAVAAKGNGRCYLRIDDTNPELHSDTNLPPLISRLTEDFEVSLDDPQPYIVDDTGCEVVQPEMTAVRQSARHDVYQRYVQTLIEREVAYVDSNGAVNFSMESFVQQHGDQVEAAYQGSKTRQLDVRQWASQQPKGGDFPLVAPNNRVLFHLASVVDEYEMGITHVVRGGSLISAQLHQAVLKQALSLPSHEFAYAKMQQKDPLRGLPTVGELLEADICIQAIRSYVYASMTGKPEKVYTSREELLADFDYARVKPGFDRYDHNRMEYLNRKLRKGSYGRSHVAQCSFCVVI